MKEQFLDRLWQWQGKFLNYYKDQVLLSNQKSAIREWVGHPGAVAVLPLTSDRKVIMVRQYRYPVQEVLLEIPAGKLEKGEEPFSTAKRELEEETGFRAVKWNHLLTYFSTPGFCDEVLHLFLAQELQEYDAHPDLDEILIIDKIPLKEAYMMIRNGEIKDSKTIISLLMLKQLDI